MTAWFEPVAGFIRPREMERLRDVVKSGGVLIVPSDSGYSLLCRLGDKSASQRIRRIRELDKEHPFTLLCSDLTHLSRYARVDNIQYRLLKTLFPGAFTCILPASREVPRLVQHDKRRTIGIRVPEHPVLYALVADCGEALMGVSLCDSDEMPIAPRDLEKVLINAVDLVVDVGALAIRPTTVLDLTQMPPLLVRRGAGETSAVFGQSK